MLALPVCRSCRFLAPLRDDEPLLTSRALLPSPYPYSLSLFACRWTLTIRTLIVDDEPLARSRIRNLLVAADDIDVAGECENGLEAVEAITDLQPDLVFLDVQMPGIDGFGVVERIGPRDMPVTVFVTAYDEFALRAFEVHALDYLLKPFEVERFGQA